MTYTQTVSHTLYDPKLKKWITRTAEYQGENLMAVAGGARPAVLMQIIDGVLVSKSAGMTQSPIRDVDIAVQELLRGRKIFLQQYGDLQAQVTRTIETVLKDGGK